MTYKKSGIGFLCLRVFCCLLSGLLVSMALLGMLDTYSYFSELMPRSIEVSAVSSEEILPTFEIIQKIPGEYAEIHIQGAEDLKYAPIIYFTVEIGTPEKNALTNLPDYILHINPVELRKNQLYKIPIEPIINLPQRVELLFHELLKKETVNGVIRAKYLNGFIDKEVPVSFNISYLKKCFEQQVRRKPIEIEDTDEKQEALQQELTEMISTVASYGNWEEVRWGNSGENQLEVSIQQAPALLRQQEKNRTALNNKSNEFEAVVTPITKLEIPEDQQKLLNILVPQLTTYLDEVYQTVLDLVSQLNGKISEIVSLTKQIEEFVEQNEELMAENEDLKQEKESLSAENKKLQEENSKLLLKVDDLQSQVYSLQNQLEISSSGGGGAASSAVGRSEEPPAGEDPGEEIKPEEPPAGEDPGEEIKPEEPPAGEDPGEEIKPEEPPAGEDPGEEIKPEEPPAGEDPGEEIKPEEPPAGENPGEEIKPEEPPAGENPGEETKPEQPAGEDPGEETKPEQPAVENAGQNSDHSEKASDGHNDGSKDESIKSLKVKMFEETVINKKEEDETSPLE
ncbi:hypothetical protein [Geosporobacter ferrireducens]|uniref:Uncharacterized protein n=1 Tax=Geosporobacter ferrireducens TaxID=1424294 RepID=A0A1D8GGZ3_9FIRM|nr:hypothetical protein [Geosporobacter ferrireducens]AOT70182.1 hypothetical protein Gferi_11605 [Geosporobacter ferrireducens]